MKDQPKPKSLREKVFDFCAQNATNREQRKSVERDKRVKINGY